MSKDTGDRIRDKMDSLTDTADFFAESAVGRLEEKEEETSLTQLGSWLIDLGMVSIGVGIYLAGEGIVAAMMGGIVAFIGGLGILVKVMHR